MSILQHRHVLIVHEGGRRRSQLARAVRAAGAAVIGSAADGQDGMMLLDSGLPFHALVVSGQLPERDVAMLLDHAVHGDVRSVIVHPAQVTMPAPLCDHRRLAMPCRDEEVVAALAEVLGASRGCVHWSMRATRRWIAHG